MMTTNNKKSLRLFFIGWVLLTALFVVIGFVVPHHWMPRVMSPQEHMTVVTIILFTALAAPVAAGVYAVALHLLRHQTFRGNDVPPAAPAVRENSVLTVSWLATSVLLTVVVLVWGLGVLAADDGGATTNPLVVKVTGQQWLWSFAYEDNGKLVESNTLNLPENREVEFEVTSEDVTHGFWIPQMGIQVDANVGEITKIHTTPNQLGGFDVRCTQFCGLNHAFMVTTGDVMTRQQFNSWLAAQPSRS